MTKDPAHTSPTADDTDQDDLETTGTNVPDEISSASDTAGCGPARCGR